MPLRYDDMIKLKQEVNKSEIMRELKAEAKIAFENTWQKEMQIRAYLNGAHDLFKRLRIAHVIKSVCDCKPMEYFEHGIRYFKCRICGEPMN